MSGLVFCISGRGRVAEAMLAARAAGILALPNARAVIDRPSAFAQIATRYGMECDLVDCTRRDSREAYRATLSQHLLALDAEALFLSFEWLLPPSVIARYSPGLINLHMGLLPAFPGRGAIAAAHASGVALAGVTYHRVDEGVDTGPIIAQAVCPAGELDQAELGLALFRRAVPLGIQVLRWHETGALREGAGGRVTVGGALWDDGPYFPCIDHDVHEFANRFLGDRYGSEGAGG